MIWILLLSVAGTANPVFFHGYPTEAACSAAGKIAAKSKGVKFACFPGPGSAAPEKPHSH